MLSATLDQYCHGVRQSSRDLLGPLLIFFGALLLAAAVASGPMLGDGARKISLDIDQSWVADSSDGTKILDRCSLDDDEARVKDGTVQQQRRILPVQPADGNVATIQGGTALTVEPACSEETLAAALDRVTLNRSTARPVGPSEIQYDDERAAVLVPDRRGYTYLLPYGFDPSGAQYFDPITQRTVPMVEKGTESMGGRNVTRFEVQIPDTDLHEVQQDPYAVIEKPAEWFGKFDDVDDEDELVATLHHRADRQLFVDQQTGTLIAERADVVEEYRFADDVARRSPDLKNYALTNLETTFDSDQQTIRDAADAASSRAWPVLLTTRLIPLIAGVLGVALLIGGILVHRRPKTA